MVLAQLRTCSAQPSLLSSSKKQTGHISLTCLGVVFVFTMPNLKNTMILMHTTANIFFLFYKYQYLISYLCVLRLTTLYMYISSNRPNYLNKTSVNDLFCIKIFHPCWSTSFTFWSGLSSQSISNFYLTSFVINNV